MPFAVCLFVFALACFGNKDEEEEDEDDEEEWDYAIGASERPLVDGTPYGPSHAAKL